MLVCAVLGMTLLMIGGAMGGMFSSEEAEIEYLPPHVLILVLTGVLIFAVGIFILPFICFSLQSGYKDRLKYISRAVNKDFSGKEKRNWDFMQAKVCEACQKIEDGLKGKIAREQEIETELQRIDAELAQLENKSV